MNKSTRVISLEKALSLVTLSSNLKSPESTVYSPMPS